MGSEFLDVEFVRNQSDELTEPNSIWDAYYFVEDAALTDIRYDFDDKVEGEASLFVDTESGWDVHVHYFPEGDKIAFWNLDANGTISFKMKINITDPNNPWGVQESFVRIGDACGNYIQYNNEFFSSNNNPVLNQALNQWQQFEIPFFGNTDWTLTSQGSLDFSKITYIEFNVDVWEFGYEMWLDDVRLPIASVGVLAVSYTHLTLPTTPYV